MFLPLESKICAYPAVLASSARGGALALANCSEGRKQFPVYAFTLRASRKATRLGDVEGALLGRRWKSLGSSKDNYHPVELIVRFPPGVQPVAESSGTRSSTPGIERVRPSDEIFSPAETKPREGRPTITLRGKQQQQRRESGVFSRSTSGHLDAPSLAPSIPRPGH